MYAPPRTAQRQTFWAFVRIAFVVAAVLLWFDEHAKVVRLSSIDSQQPIKINVPPSQVIVQGSSLEALRNGGKSRDETKSTVSLFLDCQAIPLPIASPPGVAVNLFDAGFHAGVVMQWFPSASGGWPSSPGALEKRIYRCDLTNYSDFEVFDVLMPLQGTIEQVYWDRDNASCVDLISTKTYPIGISVLNRSGGKASFYFYNSGSNCAAVTIPPDVTIDQAGQKRRTHVPLRVGKGGDMPRLWLGPARK